MTKKRFVLMIASILVFTLFLGLTSAALSTNTIPTLTQDGTNFTFDLTSDSNITENVAINISTITEDGKTITFTSPVVSLTNETKTVTIDYSVQTGFDFLLGKEYTTTMTLDSDFVNTTDLTKTVKFEKTTFCGDCENPADLEVSISDVNVVNGFGDDDNYWYPLDTVEIELDVENNGDWDVRKIDVEWELYNTNGDKIMDGSEDSFKLDRGDDTKVTFQFVLDEDIDMFEGEDAVLYVKVKGEIDDNDANELDGEDTCDSDSIEVDMNTRDDFVIATDFEVNGINVEDDSYNTLLCGQEVTVAGKLWNLGDNDQDDVTLVISNGDLGIYEMINYDEVQAFEYESFSYTFTVPQEMEKQSYYLSFKVFDEDNDLFENSENDEAITNIPVKIEGACEVVQPIIAAVLDSEAKAGKEMKIRATVTNPGESQMILSLDVDGIADWSTFIGAEPAVVILESGETKEVMITLNLNNEAEGEHTFTVMALENDEIVQSADVFVTVEKGSFEFGNLFGKIDLKLALIILVNLILIIAIIVVAVRIGKRK